MTEDTTEKLEIKTIPIESILTAKYNPRKWDEQEKKELTDSIKRFGIVDPLVVNNNKDRKNILIGGHFRLSIIKELGYKEVPVVFVNLTKEKEKELNIRLNKNNGQWDFDLLAEFDENLLKDVGFNSEELDDIFLEENADEPDRFDLEKALNKIGIDNVKAKTGDIYKLGESRLMVGDSTSEADFDKLMNGEKADMCFTDHPYRLKVYSRNNKAKQDGKKGYFGSMGNRAYIGTDDLEEDFVQKWMANIKRYAKENFHIISFEIWRNLREQWNCMEEQGFKVKNLIIWHTPNRVQRFSSKYRFFSKHDIAVVGGQGQATINYEDEEQPLQEEYESALYAIQGKPHWEGYKKGSKYIPTDFISHTVSTEKQSGQNIIFGTKPLRILIPYIKIMTKRGDLIVEPFGGSGSTLIASERMKRRCFVMEKQPIYAEVIIKRWEKETGLKAEKIN